MYGATYISVQGYNARLDVVNEIRDATVDPDGGLRLRIEVVRRHRAEEEGDPPDRRFRESMQSHDFEVRLRPVAGCLTSFAASTITPAPPRFSHQEPKDTSISTPPPRDESCAIYPALTGALFCRSA